MSVLNVLLVDDDPESLTLLRETLPDTIAGETIRWEPCEDFDDAFRRISERRFDIVVTDIYRDQEGVEKQPVTGDPRGTGLLDEIRKRRFSPVLFFTDGVFPPDYSEGPFLKLADKSANNETIVSKMTELIETGVPVLAHQLHDELDSTNGSYLWEFLEAHWETLREAGLAEPNVLNRLLHRRASVQLGRLVESEDGLTELQSIEGAEFYLRPQLSTELRLGQIMERDGQYRVVLTPHCHLVIQPGQDVPRADFVLTALALPAAELFKKIPLTGNDRVRGDDLRRRLQSPAQFGKPDGRYWFLPGFLAMPHQYVDLLQLQSVPIAELRENWESFAVLDVPFAEALQSSFVRFYSAIGLPSLDPARFGDMNPPPAAAT
jgi:CheY-like chemotaxis protein